MNSSRGSKWAKLVCWGVVRASGCRPVPWIIVCITRKGSTASLIISAGVNTRIELIEDVGIMWASISATAVVLNGAKMVTIWRFFRLDKSVLGNPDRGGIRISTDCFLCQV